MGGGNFSTKLCVSPLFGLQLLLNLCICSITYPPAPETSTLVCVCVLICAILLRPGWCSEAALSRFPDPAGTPALCPSGLVPQEPY